MSKPRKRRVVIRLTPRERTDAKAALDAFRVALKPTGVSFAVLSREETREENADADRRMANEQLETAARKAAAVVLDQKAAELRQQAPACTKADDEGKATAEARWKLLVKLQELAAKGWTWTVGAALDWALKKVK